MAAKRPQSRHSLTCGENCRQVALSRRGLPILPFAEIYTVIDLVSMTQEAAGVKVAFTWKVTGWFMVGWSPEFPTGEVRPMHYFGDDLEIGRAHV